MNPVDDYQDVSSNMNVSLPNMNFDSDKEELIDEMQQKFGELLKVNQQLTDSRREVEDLRHKFISIETTFTLEKERMQNRIEKLNLERNEMNSEIKFLVEERTKLENNITEYENTISSFKNTISELQEALNLNRTEAASKGDELSPLTSKNGSIIMELYDQIDNLTKRLSESGNENALLRERNLNLEYDIRKIQKEKQEDRENNTLNKQSAEKNISMNQLNDNMNREFNEIKADYEELKAKNKRVHELLPEFQDFDTLMKELSEKVKIAETLPIEFRKLQKQHNKTLKYVEGLEQDMNAYQKDAKEKQNEIIALQKEVDRLTLEMRNKDMRMEKQVARLSTLPIIEKANHDLVKRLRHLENSINNLPDSVSLRSLIIVSIILKRWKSLVGTDKKYAKDGKNWWWLGRGREFSESSSSEAIRSLASINENKAQLEKQVQQLKTMLTNSQEALESAEKRATENANQLQKVLEENKLLENNMKNMKDNMKTMMIPGDYEQMIRTFDKTKDKYRYVATALAKTTEELLIARHELQILRQKQARSEALLNCREKKDVKMQIKLKEQDQELRILKSTVSAKDEEINQLEEVRQKLQHQPSAKKTNHLQDSSVETSPSTQLRSNKTLYERLLTMSRNI